jgi:hypothetical protein
MLRIFEDWRQGWAQGRSSQADPAPRGAGGDEDQDNALAELTDLAEQLQARVDELEAERDASPAELFASVLRLPGVKTWLLSRFHPDKHPDANETERRVLTDTLQKINAAYEILERGK